jgi:LacI family transcriptional regulator
MSKKVTMQQIADQLGVSKFVVSKALSGKGGVRDETRERVIQAASQLGYFAQNNAYNKAVKAEAAAPLKPPASGKQSVVVLMPNIRFQTKESQYWGRILDGIGARLEADGFGMIIVSEQSVEHFTHFLNPNGILGLIGVGEVSTPLLLEVHRIGLPIVLVDHEDMLIPTDTVFANNYESMHRLTKHLIASGHRRLAFVGDVAYSRSFKDRFFGFRSAAEDTWGVGCADEWLLTVAGYEPEQFEEPIRQWAARRVKAGSLPTALVCANDSIAIGAIAAMQSLGIAVPEGISITGFDNIEHAARMLPALTTVNVPKERLGARAVERLLDRISSRHGPMEKLLLSSELLYRASSAPAPDGGQH